VGSHVCTDPSTMSTALYDHRAIFFGSTADLYVGESGVARYFQAVPPGFVIDARFSERVVAQLTESVIISGAYVTFRLSRPEGRSMKCFESRSRSIKQVMDGRSRNTTHPPAWTHERDWSLVVASRAVGLRDYENLYYADSLLF
jgi:hypothetical protein